MNSIFNKYIAVLALGLGFLFSSSQLMAQREMSEYQVTEQPGFYIAPYTLYPGNLQVESTLQADVLTDGFTARAISIPNALVRYGLTDHLELRAQTGFVLNTFKANNLSSSESGLIPLTLGAKIQVTEPGKTIPPIALRAHFQFPELGLNPPDFLAPSFLVTTNVPFLTDFQTYLNLGIAWNGIDAAPTYQYAVALERSLMSGMTGYLEAYGFTGQGNLDHRYDLGLIYAFSPDLQADFSGGIGFSELGTSYFVAGGFCFRVVAVRNLK